MKLLNYKQAGVTRLGVLAEGGVIDVARACKQLDINAPCSMEEAIEAGGPGIDLLRFLLNKDLPLIPPEELEYAPIVASPSKILCIGLNYRDHAEESGMEIPEFPVVFSKFGNALAAHGEEIPIPKGVQQCDYEVELVAVIGKRVSHVEPEQALDCIYGYTVGNDISARDWQFLSSQWLLGKTCDKFAPTGPWLVTADQVDPGNLEISLHVNGQLRQLSNTRHMIFSVAQLVSLLSKHITLEPGDLLFTGTPGGVMFGRPAWNQEWLKPGDEIVAEVKEIGVLHNRIR